MASCGGIDELCSHTQLSLLTLHASLEQVASVECDADLARIALMWSESQRGRACNDLEIGHACELMEDRFGETHREQRGARVGAQSIEGQDGDAARRQLGCGCNLRGPRNARAWRVPPVGMRSVGKDYGTQKTS